MRERSAFEDLMIYGKKNNLLSIWEENVKTITRLFIYSEPIRYMCNRTQQKAAAASRSHQFLP